MNYDLNFSKRGIWGGFGRLRRIRRMLTRELRLGPTDVVLDVGCDRGRLVESLRPFCREVVGIDINEDAVRDSSVAGLRVMDALATDFPDAHFTRIVSSHTIEHIADLHAFFAEMSRILRPGGRLVLYYPWELWRGMGTMRNAWLLFGNPFAGHRMHLHCLSPGRIARFIRDTDLRATGARFFLDPQPGFITALTK
jgi:SAM-dependent methyltransferase